VFGEKRDFVRACSLILVKSLLKFSSKYFRKKKISVWSFNFDEFRQGLNWA
jgi:hypothetical protein